VIANPKNPCHEAGRRTSVSRSGGRVPGSTSWLCG
jgi:hypothetical protein